MSQIDEDLTFRLRPEGDVTGLAQSVAREGQLVPIEVRLRGPGRWQVIAGFRRVAALRLLKREHVLARLHDQLNDDEALALAVADGVTERPLAREELETLRSRLAEERRYGPAIQEAIERALGEAPPPPEPEEVDLDVFSRDVRDRLAELAVDVGSLFDNWSDADEDVRENVRAQLRYFRDLLPFLEAGDEDLAEESAEGDGETADAESDAESDTGSARDTVSEPPQS